MEGSQPFATPAQRSFEEGAKGRNVTKGTPKTARRTKRQPRGEAKAARAGSGEAPDGTKAPQTRAAQGVDEAEPTEDGLKEEWEKLTNERQSNKDYFASAGEWHKRTEEELDELRRGHLAQASVQAQRPHAGKASAAVGQAARTRGGARPGAGRKRQTPEEIRDRRFEVNGLRDPVILELLAIMEKGKTWECVLKDLAREFPKYQWPSSPGKREEEVLKKCRGGGVRLAAQWYAGRVLGICASLVRDYCTGRALQPIIIGETPARLPPVIEADPMGYFCKNYLPTEEPARTNKLRQSAHDWNSLMTHPEEVRHRSEVGLGIVRYCEACGKPLSAKQVRACSRPCAKVANKLASRRAHGR